MANMTRKAIKIYIIDNPRKIQWEEYFILMVLMLDELMLEKLSSQLFRKDIIPIDINNSNKQLFTRPGHFIWVN